MSSNPCNYMDYMGGDHQNWQVKDAYGCSIAGQSPVAAGLAYRPVGCIRPRCLLDCDNSSAAAAVAARRAIQVLCINIFAFVNSN